MKLKRILALTMTASLLVSSSLMSVGTTTVYAQNINDRVIQETESNGDTEETWSGLPTQTKEDQTSESKIEKEIKDSDFIKNVDNVDEEDGVQITDDIKPIDKEAVDSSNSVDSSVEGELKEEGSVTIEEIDREDLDIDLKQEGNEDEAKALLNEETVRDDDMVRVIIVMDGKSIIEKDSDATMNFFTQIKTNLMESKQKSVVSKIEKKVLDGEELDVRYHYTWMLNGVATEVPYGMIDEIEEINGVDQVILQTVYDVADTTEEADKYTVADGVMIGRENTWASGYTGKGIKIAIIDTGIDDDHQNFAALTDDKLTDDSATKGTINSVLDQLNASDLYPGLTVDSVYRSTKIAYGFNYVDKNLTIDHGSDTQGDHGTHVAGIAAANDLKNNEAVGVAPDAQLYVMKVFGANGGAYTEDILAALEDSLILGADVINMSLGSPAGFTSNGEALDNIYSRVSETNTILAVAAGNAASVGQGNIWGTDTNLASNPDNSTVSSPATYVNATSVASVDNVGVKGYYIEANGKKISYIEGANGKNESILNLAGKDYEFAMVDNFGQQVSDFTNADVAGKVAVVQRGLTAFTDKVQLAQEAGAIACLIYNNTSGTISMDMSNGTAVIPSASITIEAGEYLAAAKSENPAATLLFSDVQDILESETAYRMSDFSSWGVSPNLSLEPDVTAPGGNIYSTLDGGAYGVMSGTSMASPNMAGVSALITQYVKEKFPEMSGTEMHNFVNALLMSTAEPLMYSDTVQYSPRSQGSGLVNAYSAVNTNAILSVDGMDTPKVELKDDPAKTGNYTYSFDVTNFGDKAVYYDMDTTSLTEGVAYVAEVDKNFMSMTPETLDAISSEVSDKMVLTYDLNENGTLNTADARQLYLKVLKDEASSADEFFRYNLDGDEDGDKDDVQAYLDALVGKEVEGLDLQKQVLKVNPDEKATVTVNVQVSDAGKAYMDSNFENGIYVEGFTTLTAKNASGVDLSLPYLGFYGDWTQAPIIDSGFYWDEEPVASQYYNILFTNYGTDANGWLPGKNPYLDEEIDVNNISLSPNNDGYADSIDEIYVSLLRNAATLNFSYIDQETGEVYNELELNNMEKSYYVAAYGQIVPFVYSWYGESYGCTDADGVTLPNNTKLNLKIQATLDYDVHEQNNASDSWTIPITVDTEAPVVSNPTIYADTENGKQYLDLTISDNVDTAAINFLNKTGTMILAQYPVDTAAGESNTVRFDVTGFGNEFLVVAGDYAMNESSYKIRTNDNDPVLDESLLYGYRVYDRNITDDSLFGWLGINPENAERQVLDSESHLDYALTAAEYVGGYILAVDANNDLVFIKPGYWDDRTKVASLGVKIKEMAFDATTETLYAYDNTNGKLVTIDIYTGAVTAVTTSYMAAVTAMACDNDGVLYGINSKGQLATINKENGTWGTVLYNTAEVTGSYPSYAQSMTYDSETNSLYWAFYCSTGGAMYKIDLNNGNAMTNIGTLAGDAEVVGLLKLDDKGFTLPEKEIESIKVQPESVTLLENNSSSFDVLVSPWYSEVGEVVWTSSNPDVATVNQDGEVVAIGVGETTITATLENTDLQAVGTVSVVNPQAQLVGFVMSGNTLSNQWVTLAADDISGFETLTEEDFRSYYAGEYLDGYVYAYSQSTELYKINAETKVAQKISDSRSDCLIIDMAYDYSTGFMYGIAQDQVTGETSLVAIDILTGAIQNVGQLKDEHGYPATTLAVGTDGTIYIITMAGILYTYNVESGTMNKIGLTGYAASSYVQSMTYDHNTDSIYWAMISSTGEIGVMYVDTKTGSALPLGTFDGGVQIASLFIVPESVPDREEVAVESVKMTSDTLSLINGSQKCLPVEVLPFNATDRNVSWTVEDESIAVIENGLVTAKNPGTTKATGTLAGYTVEITINVIEAAGAIRGFLLTDIATSGSNFWGEFNDSDLSSGNGLADASEYSFYAGEYYNGNLYGYGVDTETYESQYMIVDGTTFKLKKVVTGSYPDMLDMAFDYTQGVMYAVGGVRNVANDTTLYAIDIETGEYYAIANLSARIMTLACTAEGTLYGISENGTLYKINNQTGELTSVGETGYGANLYQSMAYDYNTGNIYWAQAYNDPMTWTVSASLLLVNPDDASVVDIGKIGLAGCVVSSLYTVPKNEIPVETPEVTSILLGSKSEVVSVGNTVQVSAKPFPISAALNNAALNFTSNNEAVATVNASGLVTAVGEGKAEIVVSYGNVNASCTITVLGDNNKFYVTNANGWETSPILKPGTITESVTLPKDAGLKMKTTTYVDGYFYAIDTEDYLWRYTEDLSVVEKLGDSSVVSQLDNYEDYDKNYAITVTDLVANAFNNKVYVLVAGVMDYYRQYYVYELDLATGASTIASQIAYNIMRPVEFVFTSETDMILYDAYSDYIYEMNMNNSAETDAKHLAWVQTTLSSGNSMGMVYSKDMDKVFLASDKSEAHNQRALYTLDPNTGVFKKYADAKYNVDFIDLILIEGSTPVTAQSLEVPVTPQSLEVETPIVGEDMSTADVQGN